jgi:hypothetical protein
MDGVFFDVDPVVVHKGGKLIRPLR